MSLGIFCDAPFGNEDAWIAFSLAHFLRHQTYRQSINANVTQSKIDNISPTDSVWMLDHAQEHFDIATALNVNANPNLGETDLSVQANFDNWMYQHRTEHDLFDLALGL